MTPLESAAEAAYEAYWPGFSWDKVEPTAQQIWLAVAEAAVQAERERNIALMRRYLQFNNQRAVSWHEVEDTIAVIRKGD